MPKTVYDRLADALDSLPNGFPRTASNTEALILERIFTPEEARLAATLSRIPETAAAIALRAGLSPGEAGQTLEKLAARAVIWTVNRNGEAYYRLAPFIIGIYESQVGVIDREFAELVDKYLKEGGNAIMAPLPAISRVVPVRQAIKSERIVPYENVRQIILDARAIRVWECICRKKEGLLGRRCGYPLEACFQIFSGDDAPREATIPADEALRILDETERAGLVHTTSNVMNGITYLCNCCVCCCGMLRSIVVDGLAHSVASSSYLAGADPERCAGCGTCESRCPVKAISLSSGVAKVDTDRCIGCGLCATGCPQNAVMLTRKPRADIVLPPATFEEWEKQRLANRGLSP